MVIDEVSAHVTDFCMNNLYLERRHCSQANRYVSAIMQYVTQGILWAFGVNITRDYNLERGDVFFISYKPKNYYSV